MKKKNLYIWAFSAVMILCLSCFVWYWWVTRDIRATDSEGLSSQKLEVKNLFLTETKEHKKYWEMYAKKGYYSSSEGTVTLIDIIGNFYDEKEEVMMSFRSDEGRYNEKTKEIHMIGNIYVVAREGSAIRADEFIWKGKDELIKAQGNVKINRNNDIITSSERAYFNTDLTKFKIEGNSVTKVYEKNKNIAEKK